LCRGYSSSNAGSPANSVLNDFAQPPWSVFRPGIAVHEFLLAAAKVTMPKRLEVFNISTCFYHDMFGLLFDQFSVLQRSQGYLKNHGGSERARAVADSIFEAFSC